MPDEPTGTAASPPTAAEQIAAIKLDPARGGTPDAKAEPQTLRDAFGRQIVKIVDRNGKEHVLGQIDLFDLMDLEDDLGPVAEWSDRTFSIRAWVSVFWLALRREGMTDDQVDAARRNGKWSLQKHEVNRLFGPEHMTRIAGVAGDLLTNLGLMLKSNSRPTEGAAVDAVAVAGQTGANS